MPAPNININPEVLNDLCSRFLVNVTHEPNSPKLCYQLELAYWFYIDFERPENSKLPSVGFIDFSYLILSHVASLKHLATNVDVLVKEWRQFKSQVPTYGCIILDSSFKFCLLVHGFSSSNSWSFPKGKVNEGESPQQCALREVEEEVGIDFTDKLLPDHFIDKEVTGRKTRLYFVVNVPFKTQFSPKCRGEIRDIRWFPIDSLPRFKSDTTCQHVLGLQPAQFFMVIPFVEGILAWVSQWSAKKENLTSAKRGSTCEHIESGSSMTPKSRVSSKSSSQPYENVRPKLTESSNTKQSMSGLPESYSNSEYFSNNDRTVQCKAVNPDKTAGKFFEFTSSQMMNFKLDIKAMMMAWDGWPLGH